MSAGVLQKVDRQIEELSPECLRCRVLVSLRDFRVAWLDLGRFLTDVAHGGDYKEWGYEDFEVYCVSELGLKKPTVRKLMVSYNYMKSFEPEKLKGVVESKNVTLPDYQTIELLKKARERTDIEEEEKEELHRLAFESDVDQRVLRKEIEERIRPKELFGDDELERANYYRAEEIAGVLKPARSLRKKVAEARCVPEVIRDKVEEMVLELEGLN